VKNDGVSPSQAKSSPVKIQDNVFLVFTKAPKIISNSGVQSLNVNLNQINKCNTKAFKIISSLGVHNSKGGYSETPSKMSHTWDDSTGLKMSGTSRSTVDGKSYFTYKTTVKSAASQRFMASLQLAARRQWQVNGSWQVYSSRLADSGKSTVHGKSTARGSQTVASQRFMASLQLAARRQWQVNGSWQVYSSRLADSGKSTVHGKSYFTNMLRLRLSSWQVYSS
jgi:hypothetical protein